MSTGRQGLSVAQLRALMIRRWANELPAGEQQQLRRADKTAIEDHYAIMQRVRFVVEETFWGPRIQHIYTDVSSCGYTFEPGSRYLVVSSLNAHGRYTVGACSRTGRIGSWTTREDLLALREWKAGTPLAPRIYGRVDLPDRHPDTKIVLTGDGDPRVADVDANGRFSFDGLVRKGYGLKIDDERGSADRVIDLSRLNCFEAVPWFGRDGWHIGGTPILLLPKSLPSPEMLPPPPSLPAQPQ